jgi:hypothetical protein
MLQRNMGGGQLAHVGGGGGWETAASIGLQGKFWGLAGVGWALSVGTAAWGEGVNVCLPVPPRLLLVVRPKRA